MVESCVGELGLMAARADRVVMNERSVWLHHHLDLSIDKVGVVYGGDLEGVAAGDSEAADLR